MNDPEKNWFTKKWEFYFLAKRIFCELLGIVRMEAVQRPAVAICIISSCLVEFNATLLGRQRRRQHWKKYFCSQSRLTTLLSVSLSLLVFSRFYGGWGEKEEWFPRP